MKIKLTDEQISLLIKNETEKLQKRFNTEKLRLEKKLEADLKELSENHEKEINKLANKYRFIEFPSPTKIQPRAKIDTQALKKLADEKKSVKEMAGHFKASEQSIRSKLSRMGIKLSER